MNIPAHLVFDDEFNVLSERPSGASAGTWDTQLWWGPNTPINNELQYYVDVANNGTSLSGGTNPFSVQNGVLSITATPAPAGTSNGQQFASGVLTTKHSFSQTYGYYEIGAEMPAGAGTAPAFWLLSSSQQWPPELDVVEEIGQKPNSIVGTLHTTQAGAGSQNFLTTSDTTAGFHTYGVDWQQNTITWYFDGKAYGSAPTPSDMHFPMYMVLNLAIGGGWPGSPPNPSQVNASFKVDYVHVWDQFPGATSTSSPSDTFDTLSLYMSEDAYKGDAQFTVSVNGSQVGGVMTASALHASGSSNLFTLTGNWGTNASVKVQFLNDARGNTLANDRNLYVNSLSYDGNTYAGAALYTAGITTFQAGQASTATRPADILTLHLSEDYYLANAEFKLAIDGKQIAMPQSVTALHNTGAWQDFTFAGNFGAGTHTIGVTFTNDLWEKTASADRNLYVNGIDLNGTHYGSGVSFLSGTGNTAVYTVTTSV